MNNSARRLLILGAVNGFLFVALGAFGAHGLKSVASVEQLAWFKTGTWYHGMHTFAILITGLIAAQLGEKSQRALLLAGWLFLAGILLFSGSLYAMGLGAPSILGAVTPFGGVCFIAGWFALAISLLRA